jgi:hypothetical protein
MKISVSERKSIECFLIDSGVAKDDMAVDDICNAAECLIDIIKDQIQTYNLTDSQCNAAFTIAMQKTMPDEMLYSSINGECSDAYVRSVLRGMPQKYIDQLDRDIESEKHNNPS